MTDRYFDAVIGGGDLGALTCAALLAKRGFRVLLLGCQTPEPTYLAAGMALPRQPSSYLLADSPIAKRLWAELQVRLPLAKHAPPLDPLFQLILPPRRLDIRRDAEGNQWELRRVYGEAFHAVEQALREMQQLAEGLGQVLATADPWPPQRFFEQRRLQRLLVQTGLEPLRAPARGHHERLGAHDLARAMAAIAAFSADSMATQLHAACRARLVQAWCQHAQSLPGGHAALRQQLIERVIACGGEVRLKERIEEVRLQGLRVVGVSCFGGEEEIGCGHLIAALPAHRWLPWLRKTAVPLASVSRGGMPERVAYRYVLNVVVEDEAVPEAMARYVFLRSADDWLWVDNHPADAAGCRVLSVQALLPSGEVDASAAYGAAVRQRLLHALQKQLPWLAKRTLVVDSPHDGLPTDDRRRPGTHAAEHPWARGWDTAELVCRYPRTRYAGMQALSVRTALKNFWLGSVDVAPALGMEGRLLAAWAAAQKITYGDRRRTRMRQGQWTKVEL